MTTGLRLGEFAPTPLYNIKAVVQATGISPSTLRAWERRYKIARPQRSDSGYRLYSERDVAVIRWLKAQVDAGMSISQAVSWLGNLTREAGDTAQAVLPVAGSGTPLHDPLTALPGSHREPHHESVRDLSSLHGELILALTYFDEETAEGVISEAFAIYPFERVGDKLFWPVLREIGERRQRGDLGITAHHFANNFLLQRLGTLLRAAPNHTNGPLIWVGCARAETPEAGALLVSIYLRRSGYHLHYLGQNLATDEESVKDLVQEARRHQPALILLTASTLLAAEKLGHLSARLTQSNHLPAIIAYSGPIYTHNADLRAATAGVYIGTDAKEVVQNIDELLADRHRSDKKDAKKHDKKVEIDKTLVSKPW